MDKFIRIVFLVYIIMVFSVSANAGTVGGFGGSLEITQLANNVQLMQSYVQQITAVQNQIQQIANQLNMYQNMLTNTQDLIGNPFQSAMQTIMQLQGVINQATNLSYTMGSVDTYFNQLNPNYSTLFQGNNYATQQQFWRDSVYDHCEATLKSSNYTISNMQNEAQLMQALNQASQSAIGQKAAIQAGNNIASQTAAMIGELKSLTASQAQTQSMYLSQKKAQEEAEQTSVKQLYQYNPNVTNPNNNTTF